MKMFLAFVLVMVIALGAFFVLKNMRQSAAPVEEAPAQTGTVYFAGGCFWGVEHMMSLVPGVLSARSGYANGTLENPAYEAVKTGATGHRETVEVTYNPDLVSLEELVALFFSSIDPTVENRQGNDIGMSYRSAIFYTSEEQKRVAEDTIADVDASGLWPGKTVTEIAPAGPFWEAEPEHQDYLIKHPGGYTCHFVRPNWVLPKRTEATAAE